MTAKESGLSLLIFWAGELLVVGTELFVVKCLAVSMATAHRMPIAPSSF